MSLPPSVPEIRKRQRIKSKPYDEPLEVLYLF